MKRNRVPGASSDLEPKPAKRICLPSPIAESSSNVNSEATKSKEAADLTTTETALSVTKVISGGQTGADQAALRAARRWQLQTGGFAALDFQTTRGPDYSLRDIYGLKEVDTSNGSRSVAASYVARSMKNVDESDATIAFRIRSSPGTDKTIGYAYSKKWRYLSAIEKIHLSKQMNDSSSNDNKMLNVHRPCLVISDLSNQNDAVKTILCFLNIVRPASVNVCGHRNDGTLKSVEYTTAVENILNDVFAKSASCSPTSRVAPQ